MTDGCTLIVCALSVVCSYTQRRANACGQQNVHYVRNQSLNFVVNAMYIYNVRLKLRVQYVLLNQLGAFVWRI